MMESLICEGDSKYPAKNGIARLHSAAVPILQPSPHGSMNGRAPTNNSNGSLSSSISSFRLSIGSASSGDTDIQYIGKASELFPKKLPWVEDSSTTTTPPFPLLPGEGVIYEGRTVEGTLYISSYRLYLFKTPPVTENGTPTACNKDINVPLGLLEMIECKDIFYLNLYCKDARSFRLMFASGDLCQDWAKRLVQNMNVPRKPEDVFSLAFYAWARDCEENGAQRMTSASTEAEGAAMAIGASSSAISCIPWWQKNPNREQLMTGEKLFRFEVDRLGYDTSVTWRISTANAVDFKLCPSYPSHLLVPTSISDDKLEAVASFRSVRRLPAVVWRHRRNGAVLARCSQPEVGWLGWRSQEDENLLRAILDACYYDRSRNTGRFREASPSASCISGPEGEWSAESGTPPGDACVNNVAASPSAECGSLKDLSEDSSCFTEGKKKMLIVDARSYATAVANRARGGGCEFPQYYPQCDIEFMNLANIHAVRKSFVLLRNLCLSAVNPSATTDQSNWFTQLDATRWLHHMSNLMRASWYTAVNLEEHGRPVLVHCSDGWDRTPQIVSLAQLMIDPFYRTFQGFQILVQREWLEFGHKFADRCGLFGGCEDLNERCPIFLQFLDCVHQLMKQFPTAFQFNHAYLVKMVQHVYSNLFGTFLANTVQERTQNRIAERSHSLWTFLLEKNTDYSNYLYECGREPLWPSHQVRELHFWSAVYLADLGNSGCTTDTCQSPHSSAQCANVVSCASSTGNSAGSNNATATRSNSPCSSGYATPQQTALTDSLVDSLACKNTRQGSRNPMEDSTDTLVDDGSRTLQRPDAPAAAQDLDETVDTFPLLEASPSSSAVFHQSIPKPLEEPLPAELLPPEEEHWDEVDGRFNASCQTCQKNWDLLNRNQSLHPVSADPMSSANLVAPASAESLIRQETTNNGNTPSCLNFDLDGLLPCVDRQQVRLRQILALKEMEIEALRRDLHHTRVALCQQVCHTCNSGRHSGRKSHSSKEDSPSAPNGDGTLSPGAGPSDPSLCGDDGAATAGNASISSWETVNEKEFDDKV